MYNFIAVTKWFGYYINVSPISYSLSLEIKNNILATNWSIFILLKEKMKYFRNVEFLTNNSVLNIKTLKLENVCFLTIH